MTQLIIYLTIAIGVSFLCSILEAVLLSITPSFVEKSLSDQPKFGARLLQMKDRLDESLSSILILNTFAHTIGAAGVGSQAVQIFGSEWETLIAVILTLAILYFSEIIPKTLGATYWRPLANPASRIILWLVRLVYPLVWISSGLTKLLNSSKENEITREEILALASLGHKDGNLHSQENQYLSNILNLRDISTEEILTPRSVVHMLDEKSTVTEALNQSGTREFTRIPIYGDGGVDDITGKVIRADLFEAEREGDGQKPIKEFAKPIQRVSEKLPVHKLLDMLIKQKSHLYLVEDEFGQTTGIVTLEDAIETVLGREIVDERDTVADLQALAKMKYRSRLRGAKKGGDDEA